MNQEQIDLYNKPEQATARELYYRHVTVQAQTAKEFADFMRQAHMRGFKMQLHLEVDGVFAPSGPITLPRQPGQDFTQWMYDWACGMFMRLREEQDEIARLWPELAAISTIGKFPVYPLSNFVVPKNGP